jgi:hypothetical protein
MKIGKLIGKRREDDVAMEQLFGHTGDCEVDAVEMRGDKVIWMAA